MLTLTGLIFIPVCVAAMTAGLRAQLATFGAGAVLSSAAVVNLASFGIQPAYFMGLLLLGVAGVLALMRGGYCLDRAVLVRMAPLAVLLLACLNALFWATAVFWDDVWVVSGRQMFDLSSAERYSFRSENLNQLAYLILNILLTLLLADRLVRLPVQALLKTAHTAVLGAFFVATLFVAWDWLAHSTGIYFPDAFLHTNAFYAAAHEQSFGDIARISGPFSEPSALAYAYGGFLAYASGRYLADRTARSLLMVLVAAGALVVSTSTTAYALLALWVAGMLLALPLSRLIAGGVPNGGRSRLAVAGVALLAVVGAVGFVRTHQDDIQLVYESSIAGKTETSSFEDRTAADRMGYEAFETTWGMGIGLGSHRPSTLPAALLSNVGMAGTLAFLAFIGLCLCRFGGEVTWTQGGRVLWPFRGFTLGFLAAHLVSSPNMNSPLLWLSLTLNLALSAYPGLSDQTAAGAAHEWPIPEPVAR